ncbi:MAG: hypothetical protein WBB24_02955, partial [Maribacter sp.]
MEKMETESSKNWLQRLKDESWEAELLVSAVAIFAILKSFAGLDWMVIQFIDYLNPSQYAIAYFITVCGYLAIGLLGAMFVIHFTLRAYWIGLVGLNSVFPDYGLEDSAYSPIYTKKILSVLPKISYSISKIDELCSVIFSAAFAFMMIYLYITISATVYLLIFNLLKDMVPTWILLLPLIPLVLFMVLGIIISIPANMKKYHTNEKLQHLYFVYARWGAYFMYGPLNKSILQITMLFGSNFKKKKGLVKMVFFILFIGVLFGGTKMFSSDFYYLLRFDKGQDITRIQPAFYSDNNLNEDFLFTPEISSDLVETSTLKVFIPIFEHEVKMMKIDCGIEVSDKVGNKEAEAREKIRKQYLDCYQNQTQVQVDGQSVEVKFLKTDHPITGQFGISGYLNLDSLAKGAHEIQIQKTLEEENEKQWIIP